jgi:hypothetical protein
MNCLGRTVCVWGLFRLWVWGFGEGAGFNGLVRGALADGGKRGSSFLGLLGLLALAMAGGLGAAVRLWDRIEVLT